MNNPKQGAISTRLAKLFLFGAGVVCLIGLSFSVYYGWAGQRQFASGAAELFYYVLPAVVSISLFAAALRLKPAYQVILAVCCILLAASAYGVEGFLHVSTPSVASKPIMDFPAKQRKEMAAELKKRYGIEFDTRDRYEVINDLQTQGIDAVPQIVFPLLESKQDNSSKAAINIHRRGAMPLGGIAHKVTVVCNQTGKYLIYKSDEHGFHNPNGIWQSGRVDIAAVGNSLTLGACVSSEQNFVALIRQRYPATVNLGMPGEGPLHILAVLKEYGPFLKPKVVLWFYAEANTFTELQYEKQSHILMSYLRDDFTQGLRERQTEIDEAVVGAIPRQTASELSRQARTEEKSRKVTDKVPSFIKLTAVREKLGLIYAPKQLEKLAQPEAAELEADLDLLRDVLSKGNARVRQWGGALYFVYLPGWAQFGKSPDRGVKARARVLDVVRNLGIPLIDTYAAFQAHADPLSFFPFRGPGRYNEEGHALVAETVLNVISHRHPKDSQPPDSPGSVSEG